MTRQLKILLTRLHHYLAANPGRFAGGSAVRDPLNLLAVEAERQAGASRVPAATASPHEERNKAMDYKLEVVVIPVSDVDRAKDFYTGLGWRVHADFVTGPEFRVVQVTPPGSACAIIFGTGITTAAPGSADGLQLVATDIEAARADLAARGAPVSEVFHDAGGVFHRAGTANRVSGPDPDRKSYGSWVAFADPDGNSWYVQEVTTRLPGRATSVLAAFDSVDGLAEALRRAEAAHGKHEEEIGHADADWPDWYAQYMVDESARQDAS